MPARPLPFCKGLLSTKYVARSGEQYTLGHLLPSFGCSSLQNRFCLPNGIALSQGCCCCFTRGIFEQGPTSSKICGQRIVLFFWILVHHFFFVGYGDTKSCIFSLIFGFAGRILGNQMQSTLSNSDLILMFAGCVEIENFFGSGNAPVFWDFRVFSNTSKTPETHH